MRYLSAAAMLLAATASSSGLAMTHAATAVPGFAARATAIDPDERLSKLAAAGTRGDRSHAKPARSGRAILKDDPYLLAAYASLDNR